MDEGIKAEKLVGKYTELMPGRLTIADHRYPQDNVKTYTGFKKANIQTKLNTQIIVAGEQQTMNFYNNIGPIYKNSLGRDVYLEIAMVEEEHVTQYGSLLDLNASYLENMLLHEYTGNLFVGIIFLISTTYVELMPPLLVQGKGLRNTKIICEYIITTILIINIFVYLKRSERKYTTINIYMLSGLLLSVFTEICFMLYVDVYGILNITGHIFKILSYIFF